MQAISNNRKVIYLLILGMLPLLFVGMHFYSNYSYQTNLSYALQDAIISAETKNRKEYSNKQVIKLFANADHFYIDKEIEKIDLLKKENDTLQAILKRGYHPDEEEIKRRTQFLNSPQNRLSFTEGSIKSYKGFQETLETLSHPVEVDLDDFKKILSRIEGVQLTTDPIADNRPHLIVTECKLEKKKGLTQDVFTLDLKVLKREYLK